MDVDIWDHFPPGGVLCLPDLVLAAEKRMWLTYLKGNDWGASLSMPLTDNQLIIVLIIYSSPQRLFSILFAVSLKQSTETFSGLAGTRLWRGAIKTATLALVNLSLLHSTGPNCSYQLSKEENKTKLTKKDPNAAASGASGARGPQPG